MCPVSYARITHPIFRKHKFFFYSLGSERTRHLVCRRRKCHESNTGGLRLNGGCERSVCHTQRSQYSLPSQTSNQTPHQTPPSLHHTESCFPTEPRGLTGHLLGLVADMEQHSYYSSPSRRRGGERRSGALHGLSGCCLNRYMVCVCVCDGHFTLFSCCESHGIICCFR